MNRDSGFDDKEFKTSPYLKLIEDKGGATCICYQMMLHGKLLFVKRIKPEFENDPRMRAAFRKENEMGFSLSHPNLPRYVFIEGIFSPEEYVVTEWIEGEPLDKFIEKNPRYFSNKNNLRRFIHQLTEVLDYLHCRGIIQGDLKPSNIMLSRDGERAILVDLGFTTSDAHVLTGGYTCDFAAPELTKGEPATEASDFYSLGKIIEFIEIHSDCKLTKDVLCLKNALTNPDISRRIQTKEETDRILEEKRGKWKWLAGLAFLGLTGVILIAMVNVNKENYKEVDEDIIQPAASEKINEVHSPTLIAEAKTVEEPIYPDNVNMVSMEESKAAKDQIESEKEKIKEEVNRLLNLNYAPCINRLDSLTQANDFTMDWYLQIYRESSEAIPKSIKDLYYYEKYPTVPKDEVIIILSTEFTNFCNNIWNPKLKNYYENIPRD